MDIHDRCAGYVRNLFDARSEAEWCAVGARWLGEVVSKVAPVRQVSLRVQRGQVMTYGRADESTAAARFPSKAPETRGREELAGDLASPPWSSRRLSGSQSLVRGSGEACLDWIIELVQGTSTEAEFRLVQTLIESTHSVLIATYEARVLVRQRVMEAWQSALGRTSRASLPLLLEGKTEQEIARELHKSHHTIHDCVKEIYRCIGVRSRMELHRVWTEAAIESADSPHVQDR